MESVYKSAVTTRQQQTSFVIINNTTVKLISLKYKKVSDSKVPYQSDGSFGHQKYKTMVASMATMFTIFVNVYTDSRNRKIPL